MSLWHISVFMWISESGLLTMRHDNQQNTREDEKQKKKKKRNLRPIT